MLPLIATTLRDHLRSCVDGDSARILIGHPALIEKQQGALAGASGLNLFFYRIEHAGYPMDASVDEPVYLRLFCLISPVGSDSDAHATGEADLRVISAVIDALHHAPILDVKDNDEVVAQLQIVPTPLSVDDANKIWSTQHEVSYRLSVAYEMALIPTSRRVPPLRALPPEHIAVGVSADMAFRQVPTQKLESVRIAQDDPAWVPQIVFATAGNAPTLAAITNLQNVRDSEGKKKLGTAAVRVIVVGRKDETVGIRFARWGEKLGWQVGAVSTLVRVANDKIVVGESHEATQVELTLEAQNQQLLIWAERHYQGQVLASNMLLLPVRLAEPPP